MPVMISFALRFGERLPSTDAQVPPNELKIPLVVGAVRK